MKTHNDAGHRAIAAHHQAAGIAELAERIRARDVAAGYRPAEFPENERTPALNPGGGPEVSDGGVSGGHP